MNFNQQDQVAWPRHSWIKETSTLRSSNMAMEDTLFIENLPIETTISSGFPSLPRLITRGYPLGDLRQLWKSYPPTKTHIVRVLLR